jgi:hypothetical protein
MEVSETDAPEMVAEKIADFLLRLWDGEKNNSPLPVPVSRARGGREEEGCRLSSVVRKRDFRNPVKALTDRNEAFFIKDIHPVEKCSPMESSPEIGV